MGKRDEKAFKKHDVISIGEPGKERPALITQVGGDGTTHDTSTIHYAFIGSDGHLDGSGHFSDWQAESKNVKKIDFAKVRTVVELPPEWQKLAFDYEAKKTVSDTKERERMDEWEPDTHPSYGMVQVSRVSGHAALFGSPFRHMHYMKLTIGRSSRQRSHGHDWHFGGLRGELVEINMSEAQWARMVSSAGLGGGTPCTLNYVGMQKQPDCPEQAEIERFHKDIEKDTEQSMKFMETALAKMEALIADKAPSKEKRKEVYEALSFAHRKLADSAPFIAKQLRERMDTIVQDGKTEIEAFAHATLIEGGIAKLAESLGKDASKVLAMPETKVIEATVTEKGKKP